MSKIVKLSFNFFKLKVRREGFCFGEFIVSGISMWRGICMCVRIVNLGGEIVKYGFFFFKGIYFILKC